MFQNKYVNFLYAFLAVGVTAGLCGYLNDFGLNTFYRQIDLPVLTPPDNVFPVAWSILYILLIVSAAMVLNTFDKAKIKSALQVFWLNMLLQIIWTYVFFYSGMFLAGFFVLVLLDFMTVLLIDSFYHIRKTSAYLLVPYLFWLLFATYLNWGVFDLNGSAYVF